MSARPLTEIGAAVVGTGFIGVVHVEALRRLGVQVHESLDPVMPEPPSELPR